MVCRCVRKPFLAWRPILLSLILFAVNVYICRGLFGIEFLDNLSSTTARSSHSPVSSGNTGAGNAWFPLVFNASMPIEMPINRFCPPSPRRRRSGWPIARAFHFVVAAFYCLGP